MGSPVIDVLEVWRDALSVLEESQSDDRNYELDRAVSQLRGVYQRLVVAGPREIASAQADARRLIKSTRLLLARIQALSIVEVRGVVEVVGGEWY